MPSKKYILFYFFTVVVYAFCVNEWNVYSVKKHNPGNITENSGSLVNGHTLYSIDNIWYVSQIKNYLNGKGFTVDPSKSHYAVRRTPVYPMFYGVHYLLFGEEGSYFWIRFTQILIFGLSAIALLFAVFNFTANSRIALLASFIYAFNPSIVSYLYYTVTEALSISLVCFVFYALSKCKQNPSGKNLLWAGFIFALAVLCRPIVVLLLFSCLFAILYFKDWSLKRAILPVLLFGTGASILIIPWTIRNYKITDGDIVFLEKYYGDPMDYGIPNVHLRKWIACWTNPADFSSERISNFMRSNLVNKEPVTKEHLIDSLTAVLPEKAYLGNSETAVWSAYNSLYEFYRKKYSAGNAALSKDSLEETATKKITALKTNFLKVAGFRYYVTTPLLFFKSVIFQSNSSNLVLLRDYRGCWYKFVLKALLYLLNVLTFTSLLALPLWGRRYLPLYFITALYTICTFFVITFGFRYFECRYIFPLLPFLCATLAICLVEAENLIKRKLNL
ncbi:MAG: glycosyltransferase family 39 protein [Sphingobacteriales bacterium]|nr:glycosyltransferase family 39 protein [Sphingobacteriales bacterium]